MQQSNTDATNIDDIIVNLIKFNAQLRNDIISTYPPTARNLITDDILHEINLFLDDNRMSATEKLDIIANDNPNIFESIFSKGFDRLKTFRDFIKNGYISNEFSRTKHKQWSTYSQQQKYYYAAVVLIVIQVFGDGNHRTSMHFIRRMIPEVNEDSLGKFWDVTVDIHRNIGYYPVFSEDSGAWTEKILNIPYKLFSSLDI